MPVIIPNYSETAISDQSEVDSRDFEMMTMGHGVLSGCAVAAETTASMDLEVEAGVVAITGSPTTVEAGTVTIPTADSSNPRFDLVAVNADGFKHVLVGTPASEPVFPQLPEDTVVLAAVYVPASDTTISIDQINDRRVFIDLVAGSDNNWSGDQRVVRDDEEASGLDRFFSVGSPIFSPSLGGVLSSAGAFGSGHVLGVGHGNGLVGQSVFGEDVRLIGLDPRTEAVLIGAGTLTTILDAQYVTAPGVINTDTGFRVSGVAQSGKYLRGDGTNFAPGDIDSGDLPSNVMLKDADQTVADGWDLTLGSTTGTKIGTATSEKLGFFNATPVVQQLGNSDVLASLVTLGLRAASSNPPLDLGTGALTAGTTSLGATATTSITATGTVALTGNMTVSDAVNFAFNTGTGTKFGTATTQKIGFFNATPVVQQLGNSDVLASLVTLGLRAASSNPPLNLGTGALTAGTSTLGATSTTSVTATGTVALTGDMTISDGINIVVNTTTGTKIGTGTTQKLGFFNATPVVQQAGNSDVLASLVTLGFRAASSNPPLNLGTGALTAGTTSLGATATTSITGTGTVALTGTMTVSDTINFVFNTGTGTKIGTGTTQKIGFFNATPIVQPANTTDIKDTLINLGLLASGGATPLDLDGGTLTAAIVNVTTGYRVSGGAASGNYLRGDGTNFVSAAIGAGDLPSTVMFDDADQTVVDGWDLTVGSTNGTKIGTATTQKLGFFNATPVVQQLGNSDVLASLVTLGLRAASSNPPLNLGTGALTAGTSALGATSTTSITATGTVALTGNMTVSDTINFVFNTGTGTKIGTGTTQKIGFFNATPVVQQTGSSDVLASLVNLGLRAASSNPPPEPRYRYIDCRYRQLCQPVGGCHSG